MKKIVSLTMAVMMLISLFIFNVSAKQDVSVYMNGEKIEFDVPAQIMEGRTMVPLRGICEAWGLYVDFDNETKRITISNDTDISQGTFRMINVLGNKEFRIVENEVSRSVESDVPTMTINGRTLVPVRVISESLGCNVEWDGNTSSVYIITKEQTHKIINESLNSGLTSLKSETLVYSKFNNVYSIDNILPGLKCWTHHETSYPDLGIYEYNYSYGTKTLEDAEKYAMNYARYLQNQGYELICEMDDPVVIQSKGTDMVYELVTPDNKYLVEIKSNYTSSYEPNNTVDISIEYFSGQSTRAKYDGYFNPSENLLKDDNTFAGKYYSGTIVPDYTSVTGIPLKEIANDENGIIYKYNYTNIGEYNEFSDYIRYLVENGWVQTNKTENSDMLIYWFVKDDVKIQIGYVVSPDEIWLSIVSEQNNSTNDNSSVNDTASTEKYYAGTLIPNYTSVTGVPLMDKVTVEDGTIYKYKYTSDGEYTEMVDYIIYLERNGWKEINKDKSSTMLMYSFSNRTTGEGITIAYIAIMDEIWITL